MLTPSGQSTSLELLDWPWEPLADHGTGWGLSYPG